MTIAEYDRRLLVSVDARGYGSKDDVHQDAIQQALHDLLDEAGRRAGVDRSAWQRQPAGDGELAVLPDSESEVRVVDDYVRELHATLIRHNRYLRPEHRLRLRLGIHYGVVKPARMGFAGQGVVQVSRLVDSAVARDALTASGCDLVVIVSQPVFQDTIAQPHTSHSPARFRHVVVHNKELHQDAWLYIPGADVPVPPETPDPTQNPGPAETPSPAGANGPVAPQIVNNLRATRMTLDHPNFGFTGR